MNERREAAAGVPLSRRARRARDAPRRAGDDREAALLAVADELVRSGAFQQTPIGEIAARAGLSRPGFYFYYQSKDELLAQLVTETLYRAMDWREDMYASDGEPRELTRRQVARTVSMWRSFPEVLCAAVDLAPRLPAVFEHWTAAVEETADFNVKLIVSATHISGLRDPDRARETMATLIWMMERNCYMHIVHGASPAEDEALAERLTSVVVRALGYD
jgi:AcrR family transcriptional regulator